MLNKVIEIGILFDFYGELLTEKQQKAMRLYYHHDLSLSEIAERLEISRQGVYDHLQRGEDILRGFENKLKLINRYKSLKKEIDELEEYIKEKNINYLTKIELTKRIDKIKKNI